MQLADELTNEEAGETLDGAVGGRGWGGGGGGGETKSKKHSAAARPTFTAATAVAGEGGGGGGGSSKAQLRQPAFAQEILKQAAAAAPEEHRKSRHDLKSLSGNFDAVPPKSPAAAAKAKVGEFEPAGAAVGAIDGLLNTARATARAGQGLERDSGSGEPKGKDAKSGTSTSKSSKSGTSTSKSSKSSKPEGEEADLFAAFKDGLRDLRPAPSRGSSTSKSSKSGSSTPKSSKIKARLGEDEDEGAGASGGGLGGEEAMEEESSLAVKAQGTLAELLERA